ncbi:MAG: hypothetical protein IJ640_07535, partial [Prevotella sp.]|nr:hypothetical protein [Prevotella sp.]
YHIDDQTITDTIGIWAYFAPLIFKKTFAGTHATVKRQRLIIHSTQQAIVHSAKLYKFFIYFFGFLRIIIIFAT